MLDFDHSYFREIAMTFHAPSLPPLPLSVTYSARIGYDETTSNGAGSYAVTQLRAPRAARMPA